MSTINNIFEIVATIVFLCNFQWVSTVAVNNDNLITEVPLDFKLTPWAKSVSLENHGKTVVCVVNTWAHNRRLDGHYNLTSDPMVIGQLCTHIIYRSLLLDAKTFQINFNDRHLDVKLGYFKQMTSIMTKFPKLKVLPSVGGFTVEPDEWSAMVNSTTNRQTFISRALEFVRENNCSGLNIDWEYPKPTQKQMFTILAKELKDKFQLEGYILTTFIGGRIQILEEKYEIAKITRIFDLVILKGIDLYPDYRKRTGYNAPLYTNMHPNSYYEILKYLLVTHNAKPEKIILGVPFYGRPYLLTNINTPADKSVGASSTHGEYPPAWLADGTFTWGYNEICLNASHEKILAWKMYWDDESKVPFLLNEYGRWMCFENGRSIFEKVKLAAEFGLGGIMAWSLDMDDFRGNCDEGIKYPLLRTINYALSSTKDVTGNKLCAILKNTKKSAWNKPIVSTNVFNLTVSPSLSVEIKCTAEGDPLPIISWFKNNKKMQKIEYNYCSDSSNQINCHPFLEKRESMLKIKKFKRENAGNYFCQAENVHGIEKTLFVLQYTLNDANKNNSSTPWGWIATGVVFIILCTVVLVGSILFKRMKKEYEGLSKKEIELFMEGNNNLRTTGKTGTQQSPENLPYNINYEISSKEYAIDHEDVLGAGAYGIVFRGRVKDNIVAVKSTKPGADKQYLLSLLDELKILIHLGEHPNVVNLIGASTPFLNRGIVYMFVELCKLGNLLDYLRNCRDNYVSLTKGENVSDAPSRKASYISIHTVPVDMNKANNATDEDFEITTHNLLMWSHQIANALEHLSHKKVIHADLAARNVLVFEKNLVKLTDFGLSRKLYDYGNYVKKKQEPLPWRWMAIESLRDLSFSTQSDVWSYGVTLWEIFSLGETPFPGIAWSTDFVDSLAQNLRLHKPQHASESIHNLMLDCWKIKPSDRPQPKDLVAYFSNSLLHSSPSEYEIL